jgi:hypothetical protein
VYVCFSREIMWLRLYCARAEQEGWAAAVAKLLLNLSRCSYFFPHCCDSNFTFTHTHCLLAAGYLSHSRGARYLGARSLCTLKPSTNNIHTPPPHLICITFCCAGTYLFCFLYCPSAVQWTQHQSNFFLRSNFCGEI